MRDALSPLMEKDNIMRRKKRISIGSVFIVFTVVALIVGAYFVLDSMNVANAQDLVMLSNGELPASPTPPAAIYTLVPTDYAALLAQTPEPVPEEALETAAQEAAVQMEAVTPQPTVHPGVRDDVFTDGEVVTGDMSYHSKNLSIEINVVERDGHVFYVAEVYFASLDNFKPVFANGKFHNGYQTTSEMAEDNNAVFAVNSDSCTAVDYGVIIRNGEIYRDNVAADHLAIYGDGSMKSLLPANVNSKYLLKDGAVHVFNFGPLLMYNGKSKEFPYSHIRSPHPRTAIGMVEPYHYYFVVVDGRCDYSASITLEDLSIFMAGLGCVDAYNLDGGGSSTMVFMGRLINRPEGGTEERDIDGAILLVESAAGD